MQQGGGTSDQATHGATQPDITRSDIHWLLSSNVGLCSLSYGHVKNVNAFAKC